MVLPLHMIESTQNIYLKAQFNMVHALSMDEGSFDTRKLVAICLLFVFNKYQQGRGLFQYSFAFV